MAETENLGQSTFDDKMQEFIFSFRKLKENNETLAELLKEEKRAHLELINKHRSLEIDYQNLKTGLTIKPNRKDIKETKAQLAKLVREVDKCIRLLKY